MVKYAIEKYRTTLMNMWKLCFPDTDEFIKFYFDNIYQNEETLVYVENEIPVASLQIIPYKIKLGNIIINAGYISGAMTHPKHRRNGYMDNLLSFAFQEMREKQISLSFLIPQEEWLFDFYEKYGYKKAFPISLGVEKMFSLLNTQKTHVKIYDRVSEKDIETLYSIYIQFLSRKEKVVLKTKHQFEIILSDLFISEGRIFLSLLPGNQKGIIFATPRGNFILVNEIFYDNQITRSNLLVAVKDFFKSTQIVILNEESKPKERLSGMIKIIDKDLIPNENVAQDIYMSMMLN